jgi:hypothetical protein
VTAKRRLCSGRYVCSRKVFGCRVGDPESSQLLHEAILMGPVIPLDAPLRLWRTRGNDLNAQRGAHGVPRI